MAVQFAKQCQFPQDLDQAFLGLQEEFADRVIANELLLDLAVANIDDNDLIAKITEICNEFDNLLKLGDGTSDIRTLEELADVMGLPKKPLQDDEDEQQDREEKFLFDAGITLVDGALYAPPTNATQETNIDNLRKLYETSDRTDNGAAALAKVAELLALLFEQSPVIVQSKLVLQRIPAQVPNQKPISVAELRNSFPGIQEDSVHVNDDASTVVLRKELLGTNFSKKKILDTFGVEEKDLITEIFHLNGIVTRPKDLKRVSDLGYTSSESALMFRRVSSETDDSATTAAVNTYVSRSKSLANTLIENIDFFLNRVERSGTIITVPIEARVRNQSRLNGGIIALQDIHRKTISTTFFRRVVIKDTTVLTSLQANHTDDEIAKLLERRPEVKGINFGATSEVLLRVLQDGLQNSQAGSRNTSANAMKRNISTSVYDQPTLLTMWSDLIEAQDDILGLVDDDNLVANLTYARQHLVDFLGHDPVRETSETEEPVDAYDGQSSSATPSGVLMRRIDFGKTFGLAGILGGLSSDLSLFDFIARSFARGDSFKTIIININIKRVEAGEEPIDPDIINDGGVTLPGVTPGSEDQASLLDLIQLAFGAGLGAIGFSSIINQITNFFAIAIASCNKIIQKANKSILEFKALMDAMWSQINSLLGGGTYDSSMLKCAINFDLGISGSGPILALITNLLCVLTSLITDFLTLFTSWINDLITKVLCLPLGLINAFLGQVNASIPAICQLPTLDLGIRITTALSELQAIGTSKSAVAVSLGNDIFTMRMMINGLPDKMAQFNLSGGADCNTKVNEAYNASLLNFQGGISLG